MSFADDIASRQRQGWIRCGLQGDRHRRPGRVWLLGTGGDRGFVV